MNAKLIESKFAGMGARFQLRTLPVNPWSIERHAIDIQHDRRGPFFELRVPELQRDMLDVTVLQTQPRERHLLLFVRRTDARAQADRFLCGHDEREWFVAAVPGGASTVRQAMDALQPLAVRWSLARHRVAGKRRHWRKNEAFRRQGEWFFIPEPRIVVNEKFVLRNEPIRRGNGKPHLVEMLHRIGGEVVHVSAQQPSGITEAQYRKLAQRDPDAARSGWRPMRRNAAVFARGAVRHPDHATIHLPVWHHVVMNTENETPTMANVAFID